jgi:hypothetical protein
MIKIYFNPSNPELIFSVAAIMHSYPEPHLVAIIGAYPSQIDCDKIILKKEILTRAEDLAEEVSLMPETEEPISVEQIYDEVSSEDQIILLNIHPLNAEELAHLMNFFEQYQGKIKLWVDSSDYWKKSVIDYLQTYGNTKIIINKDLSCLQLLETVGIEIPPEWHAAAEALARGDAENEWAARYIAALSSACIADNNCISDIQTYFGAFTTAVNELWLGKRDKYLDELVLDFIDSSKKIQEIKETFAVDISLFPTANAAGRPIGYLDLNDISQGLDLLSLLEYGVEKFPWLFLIHYNIGENYGILANSQELPIEEIMEKLQMFEDRLDLLLPLLEKEVINFKK